MSYRTEDGRWRRPKALQDLGIPEPPVNELIKNPKFWKNKTMTYMGSKKYFDQDIRTGVCYFCKKENRARKTGPTYLHHLKYEHSDPLAWTIEVCGKCHYQIDDYNKKILRRRSAPRDFARAVDREAERNSYLQQFKRESDYRKMIVDAYFEKLGRKKKV